MKSLFLVSLMTVSVAQAETFSCRGIFTTSSAKVTQDFLQENFWNIQLSPNKIAIRERASNGGTYPHYYYVGDKLVVRQDNHFPSLIAGRRETQLPDEGIVERRVLTQIPERAKDRPLAIELDGIQMAALPTSVSDTSLKLHAKDAREKNSQIYEVASLGTGVREMHAEIFNGARRVYFVAINNRRQTIGMYTLPNKLPQTQAAPFVSYNLDYPLTNNSAPLTIMPYGRYLILGSSELAILDTRSGQYMSLLMNEDYGRNDILRIRDLGDGTIGVTRKIDTRLSSLMRPQPGDIKLVEFVIDLTQLRLK